MHACLQPEQQAAVDVVPGGMTAHHLPDHVPDLQLVQPLRVDSERGLAGRHKQRGHIPRRCFPSLHRSKLISLPLQRNGKGKATFLGVPLYTVPPQTTIIEPTIKFLAGGLLSMACVGTYIYAQADNTVTLAKPRALVVTPQGTWRTIKSPSANAAEG